MAAGKLAGLFNSPLFFAVVCGTYVAVFYITNNLTMLSGAAIAVVFVTLSAPIIVTALVLNWALARFGAMTTVRLIVVFAGTMFVLVALRHSIFDIQFVRQWLLEIGGAENRTARFAFVLASLATAGIIAFFSRRDARVLVSVLLTMTLAVLLSNAGKLGNRIFGDTAFPQLSVSSHNAIRLHRRPNIYLIVADSYSNLAFLESIGADTGGFEAFLKSNGFRTYEDSFSNYHSTLSAMAAMLNMQHHYYVGSEAQGEITAGGRFTISGNNNFVRNLANNGYRIHYLHQSAYMTLHGCSVDVETCFPNPGYAGARSVVNYALPGFLRVQDTWGTLPLSKLDAAITGKLDLLNSRQANFFYIHIYPPGHVDNRRKGICDETEEIQSYKQRVASANDHLEGMIRKVLVGDPDAVIVLAGDHGPFISNSCDFEENIDSVAEYRDRLGALLAIRWPGEYDGGYDDRIKSNINVLRYVLASLTGDGAGALDGLAAEDAFAIGSSGFHRIVRDGEIVIPPETFSKQQMLLMLKSRKKNDAT